MDAMKKKKQEKPKDSVTEIKLKPEAVSCEELGVLLQEIHENNKDESLREKIKRCLDIASGQEKAVEETCPVESELQKRIWEDTNKDPATSVKNFMMSGPIVGQTVKLMAEMVKAKRILEIGLFTGYGAVTLAESAFCEELIALDIDESTEVFVQERVKGTSVEKKLRVIIGKASESLVSLKNEGKKFDLVFIDADKPGYQQYYEYVMDNGLLNEGGVIICDNIFWYNDTFLEKKTEGGQALYDLVQFVKKDDRVDQMIFPLSDGLMVIKPKSKRE